MKRKKYSAKFKSQVALAAIKREKTLSELSSEYGIHANLIIKWKKHFLEHMDDLFKSESKSKKIKEEGVSKEELYKQIQ